MRLRHSDRIFVGETIVFQKFLLIITLQYYWILFCQVWALGVAKWKSFSVPSNGCPWDEFFFEKIDFLLDFKNRKFCLDMLSPITSVYFSGPAGGRSLLARVFIWFVERFYRPVRGKNRFANIGVGNGEMLEICKFVWPTGIFPRCYSLRAFDVCGQIEKWICSGRDPKEHEGRSCDEKFSKN